MRSPDLDTKPILQQYLMLIEDAERVLRRSRVPPMVGVPIMLGDPHIIIDLLEQVCAGFRCSLIIRIVTERAVVVGAFLSFALIMSKIVTALVIQVMLFLPGEMVVEDVALELPAPFRPFPFLQCALSCRLDDEFFNRFEELDRELVDEALRPRAEPLTQS
jgi:hypothetical protein